MDSSRQRGTDTADSAAGRVEMVNGGRAISAAPPLARSRSTAGVLASVAGLALADRAAVVRANVRLAAKLAKVMAENDYLKSASGAGATLNKFRW